MVFFVRLFFVVVVVVVLFVYPSNLFKSVLYCLEKWQVLNRIIKFKLVCVCISLLSLSLD